MELKDGMRVSGVIGTVQVEGALSLEDDKWYFCQNEISGYSIKDKKGFKYSWYLGHDGYEDIIPRYKLTPVEVKTETGNIREFNSGATRDTEEGKIDYEGFISPIVMLAYGRYMHNNRIQSDGKLRDSDNWQKHFGEDHYKVCIKSLYRHFMDLMLHHRGFNDLAREEIMEALGGIMFNTVAYWDKYLKDRHEDGEFKDEMKDWLDGINGRRL